MNSLAINPEHKALLLGTALWGWGVERAGAHAMLNHYVKRGGRLVDTAANYPINRRPEDFGLACRWIAEWLDAHDAHGLRVLIKIGAVDNMGGADTDLNPESMYRAVSHYRSLYGDALGAVAIHWDNRHEQEELAETLAVMEELSAQGLAVGFSGVRHPALYRQLAPALADKWWIQVKENIQTRAARLSYQQDFPHARYLAYGINMGGLKDAPSGANSSLALRGIARPDDLAARLNQFLQSDHGITPAPTNFNELALLASYTNPHLSGIIIGPRKVEQLDATFDYWESLQQDFVHDQQEVYRRLLALAD